jgi:Nucleoplasmin-like domain
VQATLGPSDGKVGRCLLSCKDEDDNWFLIASLKEGLQESSTLDLVFSGYTEFKVEGPTSVHLSGYHMPVIGGRGPSLVCVCSLKLCDSSVKACGRTFSWFATVPQGACVHMAVLPAQPLSLPPFRRASVLSLFLSFPFSAFPFPRACNACRPRI